MAHIPSAVERPSGFAGPLENRFLCLREDKAPVSWETCSLEKATGFEMAGVLIPEPYAVVDIDDAAQADKLTRLILGQGIRCRIMQTTRGRHFWFRSREPVKNSIRSMTGIGVTADYRSWGKQSQVCVRQNGRWRQWLTEYDWEALDELPRWLLPLRQTKWKFYEMGEGDGRNQALFDYQIALSQRGYSKSEAFYVLRLINTYIFEEPLPEREIDTICRDEAYPKPEENDGDDRGDTPWFDSKGRFLHNVMGDILIDELNLISHNQNLYVYRDGCYTPGENDVMLAMLDRFPTSKRTQQNEVLNYINIKKHISNPVIDEYVINLKNGRLNLKTGELLPHSPEALDFQQINAAYNPKTFYEPLDRMLWKVFCGDVQLYKLFEEMMGYTLIKNCRMQKIFIFFGDGNNGKSTLLRVICNFIGEGNYAVLSLQDFEKTFRPAELENKLVSLGDDIPATTIRDSSFIKSISSGERILVERKNKDPFILRNYATLIFTTNKMPAVNDKSYGFYRRLKLIPLDAQFESDDADFDPDIGSRVISPEAMSYLLNMAVRGFRRMMKHGFTVCGKVEQAIATYKQKSSTTLTWLAENEIPEEHLLAKHTGELYYEFKNWCADEGIDNVPKQKTFTEEIEKAHRFTLSSQQREQGTGKKCRFFIKPSGR